MVYIDVRVMAQIIYFCTTNIMGNFGKSLENFLFLSDFENTA